jgi:hypothetical protein
MSEVAAPASSQRSVLDLAAAARYPVGAVLQELGSTQAGLTSEEAASRLASVGRNVLASHRVTWCWWTPRPTTLMPTASSGCGGPCAERSPTPTSVSAWQTLVADADRWARTIPAAQVLSQIGSPFAPDQQPPVGEELNHAA